MLRKHANASIPFRALSWATATAIVTLLASCASIPPPTSTMSRAQSSLQAAQKAGAGDADPVDLEFARGKYQQAQTALGNGKNALAADLANESIADSQLALTKARLATLRGQISAQTKENTRLRKQLLERAAKARPAAVPQAPSSSDVQELPQTVLPAPASPAPASSSDAVQEGQ